MYDWHVLSIPSRLFTRIDCGESPCRRTSAYGGVKKIEPFSCKSAWPPQYQYRDRERHDPFPGGVISFQEKLERFYKGERQGPVLVERGVRRKNVGAYWQSSREHPRYERAKVEIGPQEIIRSVARLYKVGEVSRPTRFGALDK
jgi:hypothetical protein